MSDEKKRKEKEDNEPSAAQSKRQRRKEMKALNNNRGSEEDYFRVFGENARPELLLKLDEFLTESRPELKLTDLQDLFTWVSGDGISPKWVFVKNKPLLKHVVVVALNSLQPEWFYQRRSHFPCLSSLFPAHHTIRAPGSATFVSPAIRTLLHCPKPKEKKKKAKDTQEANATVLPISAFVLSEEQLIENKFPRPVSPIRPHPLGSGDDADKWVQTTLVEGAKKVLALDCEMCYTCLGLELTRVTLVDEDLNTVYDSLVLPPNPILDYNTRYSGITKEMMEGVSTSLAAVQKRVCELVSSTTVLVGHSLENDFTALKLIHSCVVDTSVCFVHPRGFPFKLSLRGLSEKYLQRKIQEATHDSAVDAQVCMQLLKLKRANGPSFGDETSQEGIPIFEALHNSSTHCVPRFVAHSEMVRSYRVDARHQICCDSDDQVEKALSAALRENECAQTFSFASFRDLSAYLQGFSYVPVLKPESESAPEGETVQERTAREEKEAALLRVCGALDARVGAVYEAMPPNALLVVVTGQGILTDIKRLTAKRNSGNEEWTPALQQQLVEAVKVARSGLVAFTVKDKQALTHTNGGGDAKPEATAE